MTYEELKKRMIDFGFEESTYLTDPMAISEFQSSINQARQTISQAVPLIGRYDFVQDNEYSKRVEEERKEYDALYQALEEQYRSGEITEEEYKAQKAQLDNQWETWLKSVRLHKINLRTCKDNAPDGTERTITIDGKFDRMDGVQIVQNGNVIPFSDYTLEQGCIVVLDYALAGSFTIFYAKGIDLIDTDTTDDFDIQIDYEAEHLVPLLAAYHAWLDDDIQKATMYYNEYEQELNRILQARAERQNKVKARVVGGIRWH